MARRKRKEKMFQVHPIVKKKSLINMEAIYEILNFYFQSKNVV